MVPSEHLAPGRGGVSLHLAELTAEPLEAVASRAQGATVGLCQSLWAPVAGLSLDRSHVRREQSWEGTAKEAPGYSSARALEMVLL